MPTRRTEGGGNGHKAAKSCVFSQQEDKNQTPYEVGQVFHHSRKLNPHTDAHTCAQTQTHTHTHSCQEVKRVQQTNGKIEMLNTSTTGRTGETWLWMTLLAQDGSTEVLAILSPLGGSGGESSQCSINPTPCLKIVVQKPALAKKQASPETM